MDQSTPETSGVQPNLLPISVGGDVGDRKTDLCVLGPSGEVLQQTRVPTTRAGIRSFFGRFDPCRVAIEVGTHSAWVAEEIAAAGHTVYVANARKLRAIWDNDKKTDRTDAALLAEIVQVKPSLLCPIKHRGAESRDSLRVILARDTLVRARASLINHVRGSVKTTGARVAKCDANAFHCAALPDGLAPILEPLMKQIGEITAVIKGYDKVIDQRAAEDPDVAKVTQPGGVGSLTGLAFTATIEEPSRFPQTRRVGSYLGLRPKLDDSGDTRKQLRITKAGSSYMRKLLVGSAQYILGPFGPDCDLRRWGLKLAERGGKNAKKRAAVAVARKLAVLMLTLWKTGEVYDPLRQAKRRGGAKSAVANQD